MNGKDNKMKKTIHTQKKKKQMQKKNNYQIKLPGEYLCKYVFVLFHKVAAGREGNKGVEGKRAANRNAQNLIKCKIKSPWIYLFSIKTSHFRV